MEVLPILWWKRVMDLTIGLFGLVLTLPVQITVAVVVLVSSGRPIFFVQKRIGEDQKPFLVWKFRTLKLCSESISSVVDQNDPRITPFGYILRRLKLDELPQLWNVVVGDMSLVGPRPVEPERVGLFSSQNKLYHLRFLVRPGLTGLAQVNGTRHEEGEFEEALDFDLEYIEGRSLLLDLTVLLSTIRTVFKPHEG
jgi:lipopolysaccharide/colanic/teichoic acid biosynthesis glycosyltransferase